MTRRQYDPRDPHGPRDEHEQPGDIPPNVHKTQRAARAWNAAMHWTPPLVLGPDSAYGVERGAAAAREEETRQARITARLWQERARARAEERRRAIYAAMDTGPLILLWPHPTPEPLPAVAGPDAILIAHPPDEPSMPFRIGERVAYSYANTRRWGVVEGARRFSTGWKYRVRWLCMHPQTHKLTWAHDVREVWEGYLTSMETRLLPRTKRPTAPRSADVTQLRTPLPQEKPPSKP